MLYFVLDFLFVFCFTRLCAFIILFPYYSSIQIISCKCVFIKLLCSVLFYVYVCDNFSTFLYVKGNEKLRKMEMNPKRNNLKQIVINLDMSVVDGVAFS